VKVVGLDLSGSEFRPTGFCIMDDNFNAITKVLFKDEEIIEETIRNKPDLIAIDAPLSLPKGRFSLEERSNIHLRECDRELLRLKIKFFPLTLGPMRKLTERGIMLKNFFISKGLRVIEAYPGGAQDMLKLPRKSKGINELIKGLKSLNIRGIRENITHDELDAITCAYVGIKYLQGEYLAIGDPEEGLIILPKFSNTNKK